LKLIAKLKLVNWTTYEAMGFHDNWFNWSAANTIQFIGESHPGAIDTAIGTKMNIEQIFWIS